jgi:hypothetical protein
LGTLEWVHRRAEGRFRKGPLRLFRSKIYDPPLLRLQCDRVGTGLQLFDGMPKIMGNLTVVSGNPAKVVWQVRP